MSTAAATTTEPDAGTSGRRFASGVAWNALGRGLPLLLALALTPVLVAQMGLDRWGLFTLALAMVGVFGVFDLGVGQALTRTIAERLGAGRAAEVPGLVGAALVALLGVSLLGAAALWAGIPLLVERALRVPSALQAEAVSALRVLALAAPLVVVNAALWGVLAAYQRFRAANLVNIPIGAFYYVGPLIALMAWDSLVGVMIALVAARLAMTVAYAVLVRRALPPGSAPFRGLRLRLVAPLLRLGGWMTAAGLTTQALLYADRFLIGAFLSLTAVAFYATPLDLVMRAWILPVAVAALVLPACLLLAGAAHELLRLWLGAGFAAGGAWVLRILAVGVFFSCAAFAPAALLDAIGRPDATARFALAQAAVFLPLSAGLLLAGYGIEGAAAAWAARCAADAFGKLWIAARLFPPAAEAARRAAPPLATGGAAVAALLPFDGAWAYAALVATAGLAAFAVAGLRALAEADRRMLRSVVRDPRAVLRPSPGRP